MDEPKPSTSGSNPGHQNQYKATRIVIITILMCTYIYLIIVLFFVSVVRDNQLVPWECAAQEALAQLSHLPGLLQRVGGGRVAVPLPQVESQLQVAHDPHPSTGNTAATGVSQGKNNRGCARRRFKVYLQGVPGRRPLIQVCDTIAPVYILD